MTQAEESRPDQRRREARKAREERKIMERRTQARQMQLFDGIYSDMEFEPSSDDCPY